MLRITLFLIFTPLICIAQPSWFIERVHNNFERDADYFFQIENYSTTSSDKALIETGMGYKTELDKLGIEFGSFILDKFFEEMNETNSQFNDLSENSVDYMQLNKELKEKLTVYFMSSSNVKLQINYPKVERVAKEFRGNAYHAYIRYKISRKELAEGFLLFMREQEMGINLQFRNSAIFKSHFSD